MEKIINRKNEIIENKSIIRLDEEDFNNFENFVHYEKIEVLDVEDISVIINYDKSEVIKKIVLYLETNIDLKLYSIEKILLGVRDFFDEEIEIIFSLNMNLRLDNITAELFMYK